MVSDKHKEEREFAKIFLSGNYIEGILLIKLLNAHQIL